MEFEFEFNQSARSYLKKTRKNMVHSMFLIILRFKKNEKVLPGPLKNLIPFVPLMFIFMISSGHEVTLSK